MARMDNGGIDMIITRSGIDLIKKWEGCRLKAYRCSSNVLTIGYGHTRTVYEGMTITQEKAEQLLMEDIPKYYPKGNFNQNQFNALTSFSFNCGNGALQQVLNSGDITGQMMLYKNDNNGFSQGLYNRRVDEVKLYNTPVDNNIPSSITSHSEYGIATVLCDRLNIRDMPSLKGKVQQEYYIKGEEINPYYRVHKADGFVWVEYERRNGQKGYCASRTIDNKEIYLKCR